jgi:hypothetical protein
MASYDIHQQANESEEDHLIRLLAYADEWVFDINEKDIPKEGAAMSVYELFLEIQNMGISQLEDEYASLLKSKYYCSNTFNGYYCRARCCIMEKEICLREERKKWLDELLSQHFNVHKNPDGSVVLT